MMKSHLATLSLAAVVLTSCGTEMVEVRSIKQPLAQGRQPANFRVAEGSAQLALGNVGLALEAYRKALREQPDSIGAMAGLATCYDQMGRTDLSRRYYEMALAVDPANTDLYSLFAQSLEAQGQRDEAARVRTELAARVVAPEAPREAPGSVAVLPPPPAQSMTVALAPSRPAPVAVAQPSKTERPMVALQPSKVEPPVAVERQSTIERPVAQAPTPFAPVAVKPPMAIAPTSFAPVAVKQSMIIAPRPPAPQTVERLAVVAPTAPAPTEVQRPTILAATPRARVFLERPAGLGVRLERLSLREVALVTRSEPRWEAKTVARTATSTTIRFEKKAQPAVTLLNAARVQGLAARTRAYLAGRGFIGARIGDAPAVRWQSTIVYGTADAARAERLAAQFGFALERREGTRQGVFILLGRDAARDAALRLTA